MRVVLIDPEKQSQEIGIMALDQTFPHQLRQAMGVPEADGLVSQPLRPGLTVFLHDRGILVPNARYWRLENTLQVFAGRSVVIATDPATAQFVDLKSVEGVEWLPRLRLERLDESLRMVPSPDGSIIPVIVRQPVFGDIPAEAPVEPQEAVPGPSRRIWTVYAKSGSHDHPGDGYKAIPYEIGPNGHRVISDPIESDNLDVLYALMEVDETDGDVRYGRDPRDDASVVETWLVKAS